MEKKRNRFLRGVQNYVCYALYAQACFLLSTLQRWWGRVGCGRVSYVSHQYPYIDSWFCVGDRYRRKNLANKKKIDELLNNKENNGF